MSTPPRFRQSHAKVLLSDCPALLRAQLVREGGRSEAMRAGSLLDALVFEQTDRIEYVEAFYKSGPRKGEPCTDWQGSEARAAKERIAAEGKIPAFITEADALEETVAAIKGRIRLLARDWAAGHPFEIKYQLPIEWTSTLGVECVTHGLDVAVIIEMPTMVKGCIIDVKHTAALPQMKFERQVAAMGWDIQAAAYTEALQAYLAGRYTLFSHVQEYAILATSSLEHSLPPVARELDPSYRELGRMKWAKAQRVWKECLATDTWPGYPELPAAPSRIERLELERLSAIHGDEPSEAFEEEP